MKLVYYILYGLINFFILIGDVTRYIFVAPYKFATFLGAYFLRVGSLTIKSIMGLKLPPVKTSVKIKSFKISFPKFRLPKVRLPKFRLPKIRIAKVPTFSRKKKTSQS